MLVIVFGAVRPHYSFAFSLSPPCVGDAIAIDEVMPESGSKFQLDEKIVNWLLAP